MSRMLAALKKLESTGQLKADVPVAASSRPASTPPLSSPGEETPSAEAAAPPEEVVPTREAIPDAEVLEANDDDTLLAEESGTQPPVDIDTVSSVDDEAGDPLMDEDAAAHQPPSSEPDPWQPAACEEESPSSEDLAPATPAAEASLAGDEESADADDDTMLDEDDQESLRHIEELQQEVARAEALRAELLGAPAEPTDSSATGPEENQDWAGPHTRAIDEDRAEYLPFQEAAADSQAEDELAAEDETAAEAALPDDYQQPTELEEPARQGWPPAEEDELAASATGEMETPAPDAAEPEMTAPDAVEATEPNATQPAEAQPELPEPSPPRRNGPLKIPFHFSLRQQPTESDQPSEPEPASPSGLPLEAAEGQSEAAEVEGSPPVPPRRSLGARFAALRQQRELVEQPVIEPAWQEALLQPAAGPLSEQLSAAWRKLQALMAERTARVCLVFGAESHDDVSRLTVQLALQAIDQTRGQILLVDADPRQRRLSRRLAEVASESQDEDQPPGLLALPALSERLVLLPAPEDETPHDCSERLEYYLRRFEDRHRLAFIDGGGEENPFFSLLVQACDAALLHVRLGSVTLEQAQAALKKLHSLGVPVLGTVVTGVAAAEAEEVLGEVVAGPSGQ